VAQQVLVQLVDDLDGTASNDVTAVQFGLDGVTYEIDLRDANAEKLRGVLAAYVASGRRTGGRVKRGTRPAGGAGSSANGEAGQIREWALANGIELAARGRIPGHVVESYREAQNNSANGSAPKRRSRTKKS
jgi:hypothetical protein